MKTLLRLFGAAVVVLVGGAVHASNASWGFEEHERTEAVALIRRALAGDPELVKAINAEILD